MGKNKTVMKGSHMSRCTKRRTFSLGQAELVSHAILVGFSMFLIFVIITTFTNVKEDYQIFVGGSEIKEMCFVMRGAIEKVYNPTDYNFTTNTMLGSMQTRLPDRITDIRYRATFFNKSIIIESPGIEFNDTCKIGFTADYNGSTSGGLTRFSYTKFTNGTDVIEMVKL
ncbi:MAG TPA: hypothetical protein HA230_05165 [Candidatus Aenigmarchaeota archaeon]|nr:hypothetical protein [Candidatus Aenigmarchaeota archaeon]